MIFTDKGYDEMLEKLFLRFPTFQKTGITAYKPGIANMEFFDQLASHPHRKYRVIHVAGTNGKGSVSNMLASVLASCGMRVGLYTSPHILDFRERMRVVSGDSFSLVPKEYVWDFVQKWQETFDHLDLSFFEITTMMAMCWFADAGVDAVVLETGLGGRLDSTNIVTPDLSIITNIGLDHCDLLGDTLPEIAFEKAGIVKPCIPVVVGESNPQTDAVFERKVLYTNLSEPCYAGSRSAIMSLLTFADQTTPALWDKADELLSQMDLRGDYQKKNLRTVLAALDVLEGCGKFPEMAGGRDPYPDALVHAARRTGFHGRWDQVSDKPRIICDIGHNEHGLKYNFAQLSAMKERGECSQVIVIYGSVADKDLDAVLPLMPSDMVYIFTQADSRRALPAGEILARHEKYMNSGGMTVPEVYCEESVADALALACRMAGDSSLVYVGGSTYVVSEAIDYLQSQVEVGKGK